jgi:Protein of unknown function (DUF1566)
MRINPGFYLGVAVVALLPLFADVNPKRPAQAPRVPLQRIQDSATWTDPETSLTWAAKDNEYDLNWQEAMDYCPALKTGGYRDWELPSIQKLQQAYHHNIQKHVRLTACCAWSSTKNGSGEAWGVDFVYGSRYSYGLGPATTYERCVYAVPENDVGASVI